MNARYVVLVLLVVAIVGLVGAVVYRGTQQAVIGDFSSKASCEDWVNRKWCSTGFYACTPCTSTTLSYQVQFSDGTKTNIVWTSDCKSPASDTSGGRTFCQSSVQSQVGHWCSNNNVYWFNSAGQREGVKETCQYGCTSTKSGGTTKVGCDPAPTTGSSAGAYCLPNTNYLCPSAIVSGGNYYCDESKLVYCPAGCANGACKTATCQSTCDREGYTECDGTDGFRTCARGAGGCLYWFNKQYCGNTQVCSGGQCVTRTTTTTTSPAPSVGGTCTQSFTCQSETVVLQTRSDCSTTTFTCGSGRKCVSGECVPVQQQNLAPVPIANLCDGVSCPDYCDAEYTRKTGGYCELTTGQCAYANVQIQSEQCLPTPTSGSVVGTTPTGGVVVDAPARGVEESRFWSWFDKYGYYVGGALIAVLVSVFLLIDGKGRKKKGR